jgi:hypothetical protein
MHLLFEKHAHETTKGITAPATALARNGLSLNLGLISAQLGMRHDY